MVNQPGVPALSGANVLKQASATAEKARRGRGKRLPPRPRKIGRRERGRRRRGKRQPRLCQGRGREERKEREQKAEASGGAAEASREFGGNEKGERTHEQSSTLPKRATSDEVREEEMHEKKEKQ